MLILTIALGILAFGFALALTKWIIKVSPSYSVFLDSKNSSEPQSLHKVPTPRVGGLSIFISFGFILVLFYILDHIFTFNFFKESIYLIHLFLASFIVFLSGFIEDILGALSPRLRLILQASGTFYAVIIFHAYLYSLELGFMFPFIFALMLAIFCIVGCINAVNIIDGLNGLSGFYSIFVLASICVVSFNVGANFVFFTSFILLFCIAGFLVFNFPNGRIFLGDGGAYLLGFIISFLLVVLTQSYEVSAWYGFCVMVYPVWDVVFSIYRRKKNKQRAMHPDGKNFHLLLFKVLKNNSLTGVALNIFALPFIVISTIYFNNTLFLVLLSLLYIILYNGFYFITDRITRKY